MDLVKAREEYTELLCGAVGGYGVTNVVYAALNWCGKYVTLAGVKLLGLCGH
jgi:hypothetical protein